MPQPLMILTAMRSGSTGSGIMRLTAIPAYELSDPASPVQNIAVPEDIGNSEIHLVLEVRDTGSPPLVSYRRVVITGE
jgi:hypothetical protein